MSIRPAPLTLAAVLLLAAAAARAPGAHAFEVVLNAQGEYLDAYLVNGKAFPPRVAFIDPDPPDPACQPSDPACVPPRVGRHVNGKLCFFPRRVHRRGQFVLADDAYREACLDSHPPQARCSVSDPRSPFFVGMDPDGWAIFDRSSKWTREHIHTPWDFSQPQPQGNIDPQGCVFDKKGRMFGNDVGMGQFGANDGSLIVFFPGNDGRYSTFCFLDRSLAAPGMPAMDDQGNIYVPEPAGLQVTKFSPPYPSSAADCDNPEHLVTTPPGKSVFLASSSKLAIPSSIVRVPHTKHWYIAGVLGPAIINEYDAKGAFVRNIVPANVPKNPLGMDVGHDGTLYYAELNLDPVTNDTRCGSVSMVRFDKRRRPQPPVTLGKNLGFPDGVTVVRSSQFAVNFRQLPPSPDLTPAECGGE